MKVLKLVGCLFGTASVPLLLGKHDDIGVIIIDAFRGWGYGSLIGGARRTAPRRRRLFLAAV